MDYVKKFIRPMGQAVRMGWAELDTIAAQWAQSYFGPHAKCRAARDEDDLYIEVDFLQDADKDKFFALFEKSEDYDPDEEFSTTYKCTLYGNVALTVLAEYLCGEKLGTGLKTLGYAIATFDYVYLFENNPALSEPETDEEVQR